MPSPTHGGSQEPNTRHDAAPFDSETPCFGEFLSFPEIARSRRFPIDWRNQSPMQRGPIIADAYSHDRNVIGFHRGQYAHQAALAIACGRLDPRHIPDYSYTDAHIKIGDTEFQRRNWNKIVTLDPWGHMVPEIFADYLSAGIGIHPTISITKGNLLIPELAALNVSMIRKFAETSGMTVEQLLKLNLALLGNTEPDKDQMRLEPDGQIVLEDGRIPVTKIAIDRVHYLPGVAERLEVDEYVLREALYRQTGNLDFADLKMNVYLPALDNISVYIIGDPDKLKDPETKVTVRVHDECGGSDVFGSDICTCRPYLVHAIEEGVKTAQEGGVGVIVYNDFEGRGLGEVIKFGVYNARKNQPGGDSSDTYFDRTAAVAGVEDARFQSLSMDPLTWLGISRIHRLISMSGEKYDAMTKINGIEVVERVPFPHNRLPPDAGVEISAKGAHRNYFVGENSTY